MINKTFFLSTLTLLLVAFSLARAEQENSIAPLEQEITLQNNGFFYEGKNIHLQKNQELIINISNPESLWHCPFDDDYNEEHALYYEVNDSSNTWEGNLESFFGIAPHCLNGEESLNTDGDPMIYHFKATDHPGTTCLYFYNPGCTSQGLPTKFYFNPYIKVTVD